ncbi:MAG TPA: Lrp/AsnC family transcriptional regulator, partial [Sphingomicrobium sp.]
HGVPDFGTGRPMLDDFDRALLNELQRDDSRTADQLAAVVPLSSSAIARRLRRLRADKVIRATIALLASKFTDRRLRALVFIVLAEHADRRGKAALEQRLNDEPSVQFCYDVTGSIDMVALFDCANMAEFTTITDRVLLPDPTVRRYDAHFVRREVKFAPFVELRSEP